MPLTVVSFATYLSAPGTQWRFKDWDAYKYVQALKGKPINKFARIPVLGTLRHLEQSNANDSLGWFAEIANAYLLEKQTSGPLVLIPLPNSSCAVSTRTLPRTFFQAQALASRLNQAVVLDCLRWKVVKEKASGGGGTRNPQLLYGNLALTSKVPESNLILVDDVSTTGGHLQAARAMLLGQGGKCDLAICAARTVWDQSEDPFSTLEQQLNDWCPTPSISGIS